MNAQPRRVLTAGFLFTVVALLLAPNFARAEGNAANVPAAQAADVPAARAAGMAGKSAADVLPPGTLALVDVPDLAATRERAKLTMIYQVLNDPQVADYFKPLADKIVAARVKLEQQLQDRTKLTLGDIDKLLDGRLAIAFTDFNLAAPRGGVRMVVLLTPKDTAHLKECVDKLVALLPPYAQQNLKKRTAFGCEITDASRPVFRTPVAWTVAGDTLVLGLGDGAVDGVLQLMAEPGQNLAGNPTYVGAMKLVKDYDQDWRFYLCFERPMQLVQMFGGQRISTWISHVGLDQFKAVAVAGKLDGRAVTDELCAYTPGPKGRLADLLSPEPVDLALLQNVPADATAFGVTRLNLPLTYDSFVDALKNLAPRQFNEFMQQTQLEDTKLGISMEQDLWHALGPDALFSLRAMPAQELAARLKAAVTDADRKRVVDEAQYAGLSGLMTVADPERLKKSLKALADSQLDNAKMKNPEFQKAAWVNDAYQGVPIRLLNGLPNTSLTPGYAVTGKFVIAAGSVAELKAAIDRAAGRSRSIVATTLWAKARTLVPEGAGTVVVSDPTTEFDRASVMLKDVLLPAIASLTSEILPQAPLLQQMLDKDPAVLIDALKRNAVIHVMTIKSETDGIAVRTSSPIGGSSVLPAIAAPVMAMAFLRLAAPQAPRIEKPAPGPATQAEAGRLDVVSAVAARRNQ